MRLSIFSGAGRPTLLTIVGWLNVAVALQAAVLTLAVLAGEIGSPGAGVTSFAGIEIAGRVGHLLSAPLFLLLVAGQLALGVGLLTDRPWILWGWPFYWIGGGVLVAAVQTMSDVSGTSVTVGLAGSVAIGVAGWALSEFHRPTKAHFASLKSQVTRSAAANA